MRRIITLVLAALLSIAGAVGITATPAFATAGACGWSGDVAGTVYYQNDYVYAVGPSFLDSARSTNSFLLAEEQSYRYTSVPGDGLTPGHCYIEVAAQGSNVDGSDGDIQIHMVVQANANGRCDQLVVDSSLPTIFAASETGNSGWLDVSGCGTTMLAYVSVTDYANWFDPDPAPPVTVS